MAGSWLKTLHALLRPPLHPLSLPTEMENPAAHRHPAGTIWKEAVATCVFFDLSEDETRTRRRFVRLESLGLSGVVFYEIHAAQNRKDSSGLGSPHSGSTGGLTRTSVFGDPTEPANLGIDVDTLLDMIGAKLVYFPSYACTSFIVGQVMVAFLCDEPALRPFPACGGFSVNSVIPSSAGIGYKTYQTGEDISFLRSRSRNAFFDVWIHIRPTADTMPLSASMDPEPTRPLNIDRLINTYPTHDQTTLAASDSLDTLVQSPLTLSSSKIVKASGKRKHTSSFDKELDNEETLGDATAFVQQRWTRHRNRFSWRGLENRGQL